MTVFFQTLRSSLANGFVRKSLVLRFAAAGMAVLLAASGSEEALAAKKAAKKKPLPEVPVSEILSPNPLLLLDVDTGKVLYHRNANQKWYPASLTKLMTAYVVFRAMEAGEVRQDSIVEVSPHALSYPPSKMGFKVGTRLTIENALKMVIVKSANDIAAALGERISGSEAAFAQRMNREARRLGMTSTNFANANGIFRPEQKTTARDLALLARAILTEYPQHRPLFQIPAIRHGKRVLRSYNRLLEHYPGTNGMKTGFVCSSGFNIVAAANRNGRQLVAIVLGAYNTQSRAETAAYLFASGFGQANMRAGQGQNLADISQFGPASKAIDMRPQICTKRSNPKWKGRVKVIGSFLEPRKRIMEPVRVYAGIKKSNQRVAMPMSLASLPQRGPKGKQPLKLTSLRSKGAPMGGGLVALPKPKP
ncbi:MAG: D-alanyl-D-alanine carboxypeptidase [Cohaesibacter sp.]|nr:D-alanyl-D-alanine carboxypeptidase [Cohaesibacter sp.]